VFWKERRKKERKTLAMRASLRIKFTQQPATISNISENGCRLDIGGLELHPDNRVLIRPDKFQSLLGTVKWVSNGMAGVEFDTPLEPSVVDHWCRIYPDDGKAVMLDIAA
jgi:hypothetical protein